MFTKNQTFHSTSQFSIRMMRLKESATLARMLSVTRIVLDYKCCAKTCDFATSHDREFMEHCRSHVRGKCVCLTGVSWRRKLSQFMIIYRVNQTVTGATTDHKKNSWRKPKINVKKNRKSIVYFCPWNKLENRENACHELFQYVWVVWPTLSNFYCILFLGHWALLGNCWNYITLLSSLIYGAPWPDYTELYFVLPGEVDSLYHSFEFWTSITEELISTFSIN